MPYFTIVIPLFNREKEIVRAVKSCINQSFKNFEIVIVDDASSDRSVQVVKNMKDQRINLVCHEQNKGVCPARNTGIKQAKGEWILLLDSDDELAVDSLLQIYEFAKNCPAEIDRLGFLYQRDDGRLSPEPAFGEVILNYEAYLAWRGSVILSDFFHCTRRQTFEKVQFSNGRAYEETYLLDFAKKYKTKLVPEIMAVIHLTSDNRSNNLSLQHRMRAFLRDAADQERDTAYILQNHGEALRHYSPAWYKIYRKAFVLYCLLSGKRLLGTKLAFHYLIEYPFSIQGWVIWAAGLVSPKLLAVVKAWKIRTWDVSKS